MNMMRQFEFESAIAVGGYADFHSDSDLDLDRVVWDPEYRREVIELLAERDSISGDAESPA